MGRKLQMLGGAVEGATKALLSKASGDCFGNMFTVTEPAQARCVPCREMVCR